MSGTAKAATTPDTSGFYKLDGKVLRWAPNRVTGPGFDLTRANANTANPAVDGWIFFDNATEAAAHFGVPVPPLPTPPKPVKPPA